MHENRTKAKIKAGEPTFGIFVNMPSPDMVEMCGHLGFDFVIIDAEHGPMNEESCADLVRAAEVSGITPIIRCPQNVAQVILRFLDVGAQGVQIPQVNTKPDALAAVDAVKYYPEGHRGLAGVRAADFGLKEPLSEYVKRANRETMVITHMENIQGVQNLSEICTVPGLDVIFIGPVDMSQSLGVPGRPNEPIVQQTIDKIIQTVQGTDKAVGILTPDGETARRYAERGCKYMCTTALGQFAGGCRNFLKAAKG